MSGAELYDLVGIFLVAVFSFGAFRFLRGCAFRGHHNVTEMRSDPPLWSPDYLDADTVKVWIVTRCLRCGKEWTR
jgi:hypothetical protein